MNGRHLNRPNGLLFRRARPALAQQGRQGRNEFRFQEELTERRMDQVGVPTYDELVLVVRRSTIAQKTGELRRLVQDLTDTMMEAPGVGLAAPQIGVGLRVFTYYVDDQLGHLINPSLKLSAEEETDDESEEHVSEEIAEREENSEHGNEKRPKRAKTQ